MEKFESIRLRIKTAAYEESITVLNAYLSEHPDDDEALTLRGMKHWGAGRRALALNDYLAAININPDSKAKEAYKASLQILEYRNTDLYNP